MRIEKAKEKIINKEVNPVECLIIGGENKLITAADENQYYSRMVKNQKIKIAICHERKYAEIVISTSPLSNDAVNNFEEEGVQYVVEKWNDLISEVNQKNPILKRKKRSEIWFKPHFNFHLYVEKEDVDFYLEKAISIFSEKFPKYV